MPQVNINVGKVLSAQQKISLQLEVGNNMSILPTKSIANTLINIIDSCTMFKNGEAIEGAFIDIRLFKASPEEAKAAFSAKIAEIVSQELGLAKEFVQINFIELEEWSSNGNYLH